MKKIFLLFYLLVCLTVEGQTYTRIVSLAPSFTQCLYDLGAEDNLIGCTSYCKAAEGDNKAIVSNAVKASVEKIISLKPDLVVASGLANPKELALLKKMGIKVEVFHSPKNFEELCQQFLFFGKLVDKLDTANRVVDESTERVKKIVDKNKSNTPSKVLFQIGSNPIFAVTPNTFMHDYMTLLGMESISGKLTKGVITREFVIANNPDYIFIATMGIVEEEEVKTWSNKIA